MLSTGRPARSVTSRVSTNSARPEIYRRLADVYAALGRTEESAAVRQTYVEKRLQELATGAEQ